MLLIFGSIAIALVIGFLAYYITNLNSYEYSISFTELVLGIVLNCCVLVPLTLYVGNIVAWNSLVTFEEYWNGWELVATKSDNTCYKNGSCSWTYSCDPHQVPYSCNCQANKGCDTCWRTEYDSCPYVKYETDYFVKTTLGDYTIAESRFPENPQAHRWRQSEAIPQYTIDRAGVGAPKFWLDVKARTEAGTPGPVTKKFRYENYILASDRTILKQYSDEVAKYQKDDLLPKITDDISNFYYADKLHAIGTLPRHADWLNRLNYLNGAFGSELQGDLHIVIVSKPIQNPDEYALSLKAYWQNKEKFGMGTLPKNSLVVILGNENGKVAWARSFTGMPLGNESLLNSIDYDLNGLPLDPDLLLGVVTPSLKGMTVSTSKNDGKLVRTIWGLDNPALRFKRVSMSSKDKDDVGGGYKYLKDEIQPTSGQELVILLVSTLLSALVWGGFMVLDNYCLDEFCEQHGITDAAASAKAQVQAWYSSAAKAISEKIENFRNRRK